MRNECQATRRESVEMVLMLRVVEECDQEIATI